MKGVNQQVEQKKKNKKTNEARFMMMENQQEFYNMTANKMAGPTLKWILSCACTWLKWPVRGIASNVKLTSSPAAADQL